MRRFNNGKISMKVASAMLVASMVLSQAPVSVKATDYCPSCQGIMSNETGESICDVCGQEVGVQEFSFWDSYKDAGLNALEDLSNTKETWLNTHQSVVNSVDFNDGMFYIVGRSVESNVYFILTQEVSDEALTESKIIEMQSEEIDKIVSESKKVYKGDSNVSHTVTFNLNYEGAVNDISPISVVSGNKIPVENMPLDPKRDNYEFTGWFTSKTEQTEDTKWYQAIINSDTTIYAGWQKKDTSVDESKYTLVFEGYQTPTLIEGEITPVSRAEFVVEPQLENGSHHSSWKLVYEDNDSTEEPDYTFDGKKLYEELSEIKGNKHYYYYVESTIQINDEYVPAELISYSVLGQTIPSTQLNDGKVATLIDIGMSKPKNQESIEGATYDISGVDVGDIIEVGDKLKINSETLGNFTGAYFNVENQYWGIALEQYKDLSETVVSNTWTVGDRIGNLDNLDSDYFLQNTAFKVVEIKEIPANDARTHFYWDVYLEPCAPEAANEAKEKVIGLDNYVTLNQDGNRVQLSIEQDDEHDYYYCVMYDNNTYSWDLTANYMTKEHVGKDVSKNFTVDCSKLAKYKEPVIIELPKEDSLVCVYSVLKGTNMESSLHGMYLQAFSYFAVDKDLWIPCTQDTIDEYNLPVNDVVGNEEAISGLLARHSSTIKENGEGAYIVGRVIEDNVSTYSDTDDAKYCTIHYSKEDGHDKFDVVNLYKDAILSELNNGKCYLLNTVKEYKEQYTVTYILKNDDPYRVEHTDKGVSITAPKAPTMSGYTFGGWYLDENCTRAWNFGTDKVNENVILYAKWTKNQTSGGGSYNPPSNSGSSSNSGSNNSSSTSKPETNTTTDANGTKVETTKKEDSATGTVTETKKETAVDGSVKEITVETKKDGSSVETSKETKADGSVVESKKETSTDGVVKETSVETKADGSKVESTKEVATDGSSVETSKETKADGSTTEISKKTDANGDSNSVILDTNIDTKDVLKVTKSESSTGEVTKAAATLVTSDTVISKDVANKANTFAGTDSIKLKLEVRTDDGKLAFKVRVDTSALEANKTLYTYKYDSKTKKYNLVESSMQKVKTDANANIECDFEDLKSTQRYEIVTKEKATEFNKKILATVKPKVYNKTIKDNKSTTFAMSNSLNMENVKSIKYTSSNKNVATINKNGKVVAKNDGKTKVSATVTLLNGKKKTVKMNITVS